MRISTLSNSEARSRSEALKIQPGDLIHGDRHGIINVPPEVAPRFPAVAAQIAEKKRQVIELLQKPGVSYEELGRAVRELLDFHMVRPGNGEHQWE